MMCVCVLRDVCCVWCVVCECVVGVVWGMCGVGCVWCEQ